jgi:effector-binding domain-containing protein
MNKKKYLLILSLIAFSCFIYWGLQPKWQKKTIKIEATNQDIQDYIEQPKNITKWLSPFNNKLTLISNNILKINEEELNVKNANLIKTEWEYTTKQKNNKYYLKIIPTEDGYTKLDFFYKANWFENTLGLGTNKNNITNVQALKNYLENPKLFYNLDIIKTKIVDTLFLVSNKTMSKNNSKKTIEDCYKTLLKFVTNNSLEFTGVRIIHENEINENEIELYAGIGIKKLIKINQSDSFKIMQMPKGNLLTANYFGKFTEREETVKRFVSYARKNKYFSMAIAFEKWNDSSFLITDTGNINLQICLPIY